MPHAPIAFGGAGSYLFFTHQDLPSREYTIGGIAIPSFSSGLALWYYFAAVSVFAAAVGLFGMVSALAANRRMVKAFEAFYVLSLMTQFALVAWLLIYFKGRQSNFDDVCNASKDGLFSMPLVPSFASDWSCQKLFTAAVLTMGIGGLIWIAINFFMTNRVIHYARELFTDKANRYKVLGEAATKELDREQQIPLNYTNIGQNNNDNPNHSDQLHNMHHNPQPSYRDEIEYKDPRFDDGYQNRNAVGYSPYAQSSAQFQQDPYQPHVAPGFNHRDSQQGMDLVNPYYADQNEHIPQPPVASSSSAAVSVGVPGSGTGQSFTHASTSKIASPFDDDDVPPPPAPAASGPLDLDIKIPVSLSHQDSSQNVLSPTGVKSPVSPTGHGPAGSSGSGHKF
ncbi:hypothetical protein BGZ93_000153 [Podila epicladia]|nr:hypothetical protein BGZ92_000805 [Podila epicladia]KAG0086375.1 hypothetical protein BGZ93_000153 [Podila epicladia]